MDESSLTFQYAEHTPVRELIHTLTDCVESVSLDFDQWETTYVQGPGLYIVIVAGTSIAEYADPMGANRWPVEECEVVTHDSLFEAARTVALNRDGAVVVTVVLVVVTTARAVGIARPAWRLVVDQARNGPLGLLVAAVLLLVFAVVGWELRKRHPAPSRLRGRRR